MNIDKDIVIIYHDQCRDGFGAAYAAWKKFGETANYIPRKTQDPVPEGLVGKQIYIVDYSYPKPELEKLRTENDSVVVIDHHETAREAVQSFPENVFDLEKSGAVLAWEYFHPGTAVPKLLLYIQDHDLWQFKLEHTREFGASLGEYTMDFETWDTLNRNFEDKKLFDSFIGHGAIIAGFEDRHIRNLLRFKELVSFEEHEVYAVNCSRIYRSALGHELANINESEGRPPIGIVYYHYDGMTHCSLRSNGDWDVAAVAQKYGGGGHKNAASIRVPTFAELPFTFK